MLVRFGRFGHPLYRVIPVLAFLFWLSSGVPWSPNAALSARDIPTDKSARMRLLAAAGSEQGIYHAAAEVELEPSAITYWREPGEAGVPPRFSFEGSENIAAAEVLYPAPMRIDEGGIEAFGYRAGTVFPIRVRPQDASKPSLLKLTLDYAVCETICIPVRGAAEIALPQQGADNADALIKAAEARVPVPLSLADVAAKVVLVPQKGAAKPTWTFSWKGETGLDDLFAEAPEGWFFETHKTGEGEFSLIAVEAPSTAANPIDVLLTATSRLRSYEFTVKLDPAAAKPR
jgi:DsbC/DsbD-like thiol-disulfide interchange protein